jgi:hypothetical protein
MISRNRFAIAMLATIAAALVISNNAMAYIGPGSGLEFIGYGLGLVIMLGAAFLSAIMWPVYVVWHKVRGKKPQASADQPAAPTAPVESAPLTPPPAPTNEQATPSAEPIS